MLMQKGGSLKYSLVSAQSVARGAVRCASQVLDCGAQAVARGVARCAPKVLCRGDQAAALLCVAGT
jgi:hypothetical protein